MHPQFAGGVSLGVALLAAWAINAHAKGNPSVLVMFLPTFWLLVQSMGFVAISGAITGDKGTVESGWQHAALSLLSMAICMMICERPRSDGHHAAVQGRATGVVRPT